MNRKLLGIEKIGIIDSQVVNLCEVKFYEKINFFTEENEDTTQPINVSQRDKEKLIQLEED